MSTAAGHVLLLVVLAALCSSVQAHNCTWATLREPLWCAPCGGPSEIPCVATHGLCAAGALAGSTCARSGHAGGFLCCESASESACEGLDSARVCERRDSARVRAPLPLPTTPDDGLLVTVNQTLGSDCCFNTTCALTMLPGVDGFNWSCSTLDCVFICIDQVQRLGLFDSNLVSVSIRLVADERPFVSSMALSFVLALSAPETFALVGDSPVAVDISAVPASSSTWLWMQESTLILANVTIVGTSDATLTAVAMLSVNGGLYCSFPSVVLQSVTFAAMNALSYVNFATLPGSPGPCSDAPSFLSNGSAFFANSLVDDVAFHLGPLSASVSSPNALTGAVLFQGAVVVPQLLDLFASARFVSQPAPYGTKLMPPFAAVPCTPLSLTASFGGFSGLLMTVVGWSDQFGNEISATAKSALFACGDVAAFTAVGPANASVILVANTVHARRLNGAFGSSEVPFTLLNWVPYNAELTAGLFTFPLIPRAAVEEFPLLAALSLSIVVIPGGATVWSGTLTVGCPPDYLASPVNNMNGFQYCTAVPPLFFSLNPLAASAAACSGDSFPQACMVPTTGSVCSSNLPVTTQSECLHPTSTVVAGFFLFPNASNVRTLGACPIAAACPCAWICSISCPTEVAPLSARCALGCVPVDSAPACNRSAANALSGPGAMICSVGYEGVGCAACARGHFQTLLGECDACPHTSVHTALASLAGALALLLVFATSLLFISAGGADDQNRVVPLSVHRISWRDGLGVALGALASRLGFWLVMFRLELAVVALQVALGVTVFIVMDLPLELLAGALALVLALATFALIDSLSLAFRRARAKKSASSPDAAAGAAAGPARRAWMIQWRSTNSVAQSRVKIAVFFAQSAFLIVQVVLRLEAVRAADLAASVPTFFVRTAALISSLGFSLRGAECLGMSFTTRFYVFLAVPPTLVLLFTLAFGARALQLALSRRRERVALRLVPGSATLGPAMHRAAGRLGSLVVLVVYVFVGPIVAASAPFLSCYNPLLGGVEPGPGAPVVFDQPLSVLIGAPWISCESPQGQSLFIASATTVALSLAAAVVLGLLAWKHSEADAFAFYRSGYLPHCLHWETLVFVRRVLVALIMPISGPMLPSATCLLLPFVALQCYFAPYASAGSNVLDLAAMLMLLAIGTGYAQLTRMLSPHLCVLVVFVSTVAFFAVVVGFAAGSLVEPARLFVARLFGHGPSVSIQADYAPLPADDRTVLGVLPTTRRLSGANATVEDVPAKVQWRAVAAATWAVLALAVIGTAAAVPHSWVVACLCAASAVFACVAVWLGARAQGDWSPVYSAVHWHVLLVAQLGSSGVLGGPRARPQLSLVVNTDSDGLTDGASNAGWLGTINALRPCAVLFCAFAAAGVTALVLQTVASATTWLADSTASRMMRSCWKLGAASLYALALLAPLAVRQLPAQDVAFSALSVFVASLLLPGAIYGALVVQGDARTRAWRLELAFPMAADRDTRAVLVLGATVTCCALATPLWALASLAMLVSVALFPPRTWTSRSRLFALASQLAMLSFLAGSFLSGFSAVSGGRNAVIGRALAAGSLVLLGGSSVALWVSAVTSVDAGR